MLDASISRSFSNAPTISILSSFWGGMTKQSREDLDILGFITVRRHGDLGYFGGLLLLNSLGRPLEFHCTLPHRPSRAQEILYGASLEPFLCGEQIARVLVTRAKKGPSMVFTDSQPVLALRATFSIYPFSLFPKWTFSPRVSYRALRPISSNLVRATISKMAVSTMEEYASDLAQAEKLWKDLQPAHRDHRTIRSHSRCIDGSSSHSRAA